MSRSKRSLLPLLILSASVIIIFFSFASARAGACAVPSGYGTIQAALDDSTCDVINVAAGDYVENLVITRSVTIQGAGTSLDPNTTRIDGSFAGRVVEIPYNGSDEYIVQIADLNIENGDVRGLGGIDSTGGGVYNAETLTLDNIVFVNNFAETGGAIATGAYANTTLQNSLIVANVGAVSTDGIYNLASLGSLTVINSTVAGSGLLNTAANGITTNGITVIQDSSVNGNYGGGVSVLGGTFTLQNSTVEQNGEFGVSFSGITSTPLQAAIIGSTIQNNYAVSLVGDDGEGIALTANVRLTVSDSSILNNGKEGIEATENLGYTPALTVTNTLIQDNNDGGIDGSGADIVVLDTQIYSNTRMYFGQGGIWALGGSLEVQRSEIQYNTGGNCGGGIRVQNAASALVRDTLIARNQGAAGAGICLMGGDATVRRSAILVNNASGNGAGIHVGFSGLGGTLSLANSTVANNNADGDGGGIYILSGAADLTNVTIARNTADANNNASGDGGGYRVDTLQPVTFDMVNTLVALNTKGAGTVSDCSGAVSSGGTNLVRVGDTGCTGFIGSDLTGTSGSPLNANLGVLQYNGGHTPTISIGASSPAADAGQDATCSVVPVNGKDQREYSRVNADGNNDGGLDGNPCDIGAYERNGEAPTPTPTATMTASATSPPPTATASSTPPPPTATASSTSPLPTATATLTPLPPTATASATPSSTASPTATSTGTPGPSPTPTATVPPTSSSTPTATASPGPSPTPTATGTPGPVEYWIYLPIVVR